MYGVRLLKGKNMANNKDKGHPIIVYKGRFALFISLCVVMLIMFITYIFFGESDTNDSTNYNNQEETTRVIDSDTVSNKRSNSALGYPEAPYKLRTDEDADEDRADNDDDYDPYDDPDWDESTPGESRPEHFIRGNIPDPELYPEDVVKEWVKEHGTEDEIRDVEEGRY